MVAIGGEYGLFVVEVGELTFELLRSKYVTPGYNFKGWRPFPSVCHRLGHVLDDPAAPPLP
jgi:hypothetical protein